jgi:hypothetical protein
MRRFLFSYYIFVFSFLIFFASGFVDSQDGLQYLAISRRIYYDHTIEMPDANYDDRTNIHFNVINAKNGKKYSPTGIGYSLALLPAVALEDLFLKSLDLEPIQSFPLENDWPVLLFASMTNSAFGALFVISFYYYLRLLNRPHNESLFLSFILTISSSIFIYSKHTFAHMMFVSFMFLCFMFLKRHKVRGNRANFLYSGISFGIMLITYNSTYLFIIPAILAYYLTLNLNNIKVKFLYVINNLLLFFLGVLPFYLFNNWITSITKSSWVAHQFNSTLTWLHPYVFVEGFWGILFSPGKSIFFYSPILIIIVIFWHKLSFKKYNPEIFSGLVLFLTYLLLIGTLMGAEDFLLWHGDSSFGNRYMLPTLPFFLVFIALIYSNLNMKIRLFVFFPILMLSIMVQIIGISQPYQIRFSGLQTDVKLNGRNFNVYEYGNIIPRYSPLLRMSKEFVKKIINLRMKIDKDKNHLEFHDGFGYPFGNKDNYWRSMEEYAVLKTPKNVNLSLKLVNHQIIPTSTFSAQIRINNFNNEIILPGEEKIISLNSGENVLIFNKSFIGTSSASISKEQVVFVTQAWVDDEIQNINTINYPYVSQISKKFNDAEYYFWGRKEPNPWNIWHMHSGVYEKTFDFWWLRPFHYWDLPKLLFTFIFISDFVLIIWYGYITIKHIDYD